MRRIETFPSARTNAPFSPCKFLFKDPAVLRKYPGIAISTCLCEVVGPTLEHVKVPPGLEHPTEIVVNMFYAMGKIIFEVPGAFTLHEYVCICKRVVKLNITQLISARCTYVHRFCYIYSSLVFCLVNTNTGLMGYVQACTIVFAKLTGIT